MRHGVRTQAVPRHGCGSAPMVSELVGSLLQELDMSVIPTKMATDDQ
jgi:hypothetical protein